MPVDCWNTALSPDAKAEYVSGASSSEVFAFLDQALGRYGEKSVLNMSWGSNLFPPKASHMVQLFEVLNEIQPPIPYLLACPNKSLPEEVQKVIDQSGGRGMTSQWVPQQSVLRHKVSLTCSGCSSSDIDHFPQAVGWQLSHGGANSSSECIINSVPMILWPLGADRAFQSYLLTRRKL